MGIDISHKYDRKTGRTRCVSKDPYMILLVKLYQFLARRARGSGKKFNRMVLKRLLTTNTQRQPVSLKTLARVLNSPALPAEEREKKILVAVTTITDDVRLYDVPKMTVCALRFTRTARARILKAGGRCLTLDQLALLAPTGRNTMFLRGPTKCREAYKHFGPAPGARHSKTKPHIISKARKSKREMGKRNKK